MYNVFFHINTYYSHKCVECVEPISACIYKKGITLFLLYIQHIVNQHTLLMCKNIGGGGLSGAEAEYPIASGGLHGGRGHAATRGTWKGEGGRGKGVWWSLCSDCVMIV